MSFGADADRVVKQLVKANPQAFFRMTKEQEDFVQDNFFEGGHVSIDGKKMLIYTKEQHEYFYLDKDRSPTTLFIFVRKVNDKVKQCALNAYLLDPVEAVIPIPILFPSEKGKWLLDGMIKAPDMFNVYSFLMKHDLNKELTENLETKVAPKRKLNKL